MNRRLLTIIAADVAEYSRHIEADEEAALAHFMALRGLMDPVIAVHQGHIANTAGDSVIAWFESPVEALRAAIGFQQAHKAYNDKVAPAERLLFRVGINIGDVTIQSSGDILGHGVNMAARLEALAEPGGICLSQNVMDQVDGKVEFAFSKVGEHHVKNVAKPVTVYSVGSAGAMARRLRRRLSKAIRNPALQLGATAVVALISVLTLWFVLTHQTTDERPQIAQVLADNRDPEEILSAFDLVSTGTFESHTYHVIRTWGGDWSDIEDLAHALGGYPVTIGSQAENDFVFDLSLKEEGHWVVYGSAFEGPTIGLVQQEGASEPAGGWVWQNGEPVGYTNWAPDAPDNWRGNQNLADFANPRRSAPAREWGDTPAIHASVVIEIPD
jgi:class 3 adenylate cyclase